MRAGMLDFREFFKRVKRFFDGNYSYRKLLILILIFGATILYLGPSIAQWVFSNTKHPIEAYEEHCMEERLAGFYFDIIEYNANILHNPPLEGEHSYLPYIGNGYFAIPIVEDAQLFIKDGRTLSLTVPWQPLIHYKISDNSIFKEATVTHYTNGLVYKYQCLREGFYISYQYYSHREIDGLFIQEIKISNPPMSSHEFILQPQNSLKWTESVVESIRISINQTSYDCNVLSGYIPYQNNNRVIAITIIYQAPPRNLKFKERGSNKFQFLTSIKYSEPIYKEEYKQSKEELLKEAIINMKKAITKHSKEMKDSHVNIWQSYWHTGFRISDSKAKGAINGHKINSTIYYVLSQIPQGTPAVEKVISNNEGCYKGHHTLDAHRLWENTNTIESVNDIVKAWLITLDKQGCHRLMTGNPSAVIQAIVLSLGGLRFSLMDLEFNIDPQHLHRDFLFRRISYGNTAYLNITVTVNEDNRAILGVAVDHSDSVYYGCDAGCLDSPVPLGQSYTTFPVKLTQPLTSILYITSDYRHMQELQNALHVHDIKEAPAHDHQVMALHKHGHQLGGLPTLFWVTIFFLIIVFHLFLFKLIINEYWDQKDSRRKFE